MVELRLFTNPIRSTLFGKFYEKIIRGWFKANRFIVFKGKPRVYWKDQPTHSKKESSKLKNKLIDLLEQYKKEKQFCTPDGLLKKDDRYFIWEAKNWPLWSLEKMDDVLSDAPWLLAKIATYKMSKYNINGIIHVLNLSWLFSLMFFIHKKSSRSVLIHYQIGMLKSLRTIRKISQTSLNNF